MNVSIFVIGTEISRGIIQDKHTMFISSQLNPLGYNIRRSVILPDDGSIAVEMHRALFDSDVVLITGGLGPTSDDMTREVVARMAGVKLVKNQKVWDNLYKRLGERIRGANEAQTFFPEGFSVLDNPNGTAPGFMGKVKRLSSVDRCGGEGGKDCGVAARSYAGRGIAASHSSEGETVLVASMPGPPCEMQPMFLDFVLPALREHIGKKDAGTDEYSVFLIAEARLEDLCRRVATEEDIDDVSWGTRFQDFKISLYINGENPERRLLFAQKVTALAGTGLVVPGNLEAVDILVETLKERRYTISTSESATSGLLAYLLTEKAGSSAWYWGGANTYSAEAKTRMLGVGSDGMKKHGMVTLDCALEMAEGIHGVSGSSVSVSITGIAGPGGAEEGKPVGTACFGFSSSERESQSVLVSILAHSRESTRRRFAIIALILTNFYLNGANIVDIVNSWKYI